MTATDAAPAGQDVLTGCLPLTIDDAAFLHPPTFAEYPVLGEFRAPCSVSATSSLEIRDWVSQIGG